MARKKRRKHVKKRRTSVLSLKRGLREHGYTVKAINGFITKCLSPVLKRAEKQYKASR